jgi:hypothetical protein
MLVLAPFLGFIKRVFIKPLYLYLPRILVGERGRKKNGLGLKNSLRINQSLGRSYLYELPRLDAMG